MTNNLTSTTLLNGIPIIGFGTYRTDTKKPELIAAIKHAIKIGYRHIDGAWVYLNEDAVGQAIREAINESNGKLKREDLFLVSKVWNAFHSKESVRKCLEETLKNLGVDYIDLYYIHWPMGFAENLNLGPFVTASDGKTLYSDIHYLETYKAMEELLKEGKIKNIGISNFNLCQFKDVLKNCEIKPINLQIEINPYMQNDELVEFAQKNTMSVTAYGPLGAGEKIKDIPNLPNLLENEVLNKIGKKYNKTTAQVCLRWLIQRNIIVIPKSISPKRIEENFQIFDFKLNDQDMMEIKGLNRNLRGYKIIEQWSDHKFFPFK